MNQNEMIAGYVGTDPVERIYLGTELVWPLGPPPEPEPDFMQPLTFKILTGGTIGWTCTNNNMRKTISYSLDSGSTWTQITSNLGGAAIQVQDGDVVMFKGTNYTYASSNINYNNFSGRMSGSGWAQNRTTAYFTVEGNILSLVTLGNGDTFDDWESNWDGCDNSYWGLDGEGASDYCFDGLFNKMEGHLIDCSKLIMPSPWLVRANYAYMFTNCSAITATPVLIASPTDDSYLGMFRNCPSLSAVTYIYFDETGGSLGTGASDDWLSGVSASGVFYVEGHSVYNDVVRGQSTIPVDWDIEGVNACRNAYRRYWCGTDTEDDCKCNKYGDCPDLCEDWENTGYESYEDCRCQQYGEDCGGGEVDCDDWENLGYSSREDCVCEESYGGVDCPDCAADWEEMGYRSYKDCMCQIYGECKPGCCWDTSDAAMYHLCNCAFEVLVGQTVATWYDDNGGENNLNIIDSGDGDYYGCGDYYVEVVDGNGDRVEPSIEFPHECKACFYLDGDHMICAHFEDECLDLYLLDGLAHETSDNIRDVAGLYLTAPSICEDCEDWENLGYESEDDCWCQNFGLDMNGDPCGEPEEEGGEE